MTLCIIVGSDYATLSGNESITAVFHKGSYSATMEILIHLDLLDEDEENFYAEVQSESIDANISTTVVIHDTAVVLCTFSKSDYIVYESLGSVSLTLNSSRAIPHSNYTVHVDTVYGSGNASGEYVFRCRSHEGWIHNCTSVMLYLWCMMVPIAAPACVPFAAGFDFKGGSYVGLFPANQTSAVVEIPIIEDLNSNEGTEHFIVHLSPPSHISDDVVISLGNFQDANVYIHNEITVSLKEEYVKVEEEGNLTLTVIASTASDEEFIIPMNIVSNTAHCKLIL